MDLTYDFTVPARLDETWAAFNHLELIADAVPGMTLNSVEGHDFSGTLKLKLGPSTLLYGCTGSYVERQLGGRRMVLHVRGTEARGKGTVTAKVTMSFSGAGPATAVHLGLDPSFTGPPAQLAPGVVRNAGDRLVAQFADRVAERFSSGLGAQALDADANPSFANALGRSASSQSDGEIADETDYDKFRRWAPVVVKQGGSALLGGATVLWLVRRIRRR